MAKTFSNKDLKKLLASFKEQNCVIKELTDGIRVLPPNGKKPLTIHMSVSDNRAILNLKTEARRSGLFWPLS